MRIFCILFIFQALVSSILLQHPYIITKIMAYQLPDRRFFSPVLVKAWQAKAVFGSAPNVKLRKDKF